MYTHRNSHRTTNLLISSIVHYVHLAEIIRHRGLTGPSSYFYEIAQKGRPLRQLRVLICDNALLGFVRILHIPMGVCLVSVTWFVVSSYALGGFAVIVMF